MRFTSLLAIQVLVKGQQVTESDALERCITDLCFDHSQPSNSDLMDCFKFCIEKYPRVETITTGPLEQTSSPKTLTSTTKGTTVSDMETTVTNTGVTSPTITSTDTQNNTTIVINQSTEPSSTTQNSSTVQENTTTTVTNTKTTTNTSSATTTAAQSNKLSPLLIFIIIFTVGPGQP